MAAASKLDLYPPSRCYEREGGNKPWNIWLSLNPESDSSAIWIERKFDVPKSGRWANETVFEIPVLGQGEENISGVTTNGKGKAKAGIQMKEEEELGKYTGLIVFECVPTDLVKDDIEKFVFLTQVFLRIPEIDATLTGNIVYWMIAQDFVILLTLFPQSDIISFRCWFSDGEMGKDRKRRMNLPVW